LHDVDFSLKQGKSCRRVARSKLNSSAGPKGAEQEPGVKSAVYTKFATSRAPHFETICNAAL